MNLFRVYGSVASDIQRTQFVHISKRGRSLTITKCCQTEENNIDGLFHLPLRMLRSTLGRREQEVYVLDHLDLNNRIREMIFRRVVVEEGGHQM